MKNYYRKTKLALFSLFYAAVILGLSYTIILLMFIIAVLATPLAAINESVNFYKENK